MKNTMPIRLLVVSLLLVSITLSGCETTANIPVVAETKKEVLIDPALLKGCPALEDLEGAKDTQNQEFTKKNLEHYSACADNNASLIRIIKKAFNIF